MSTTALKKITAEAKRIRKKKPRTSWKSAIKEAGRKYRGGSIRHKKPRRKKVSSVGTKKRKRSKTTKRRRKVGQAKQVVVVRRVTKVGRVSSPRRRRMAGSGGGLKKIMPFVLLAGAALIAWQLLKPKQAQVPAGAPPLVQTSNNTRNQQTNAILQYALAAKIGFDAIEKLINSLNSRNDADIQNIYDEVDTGGGLPPTLFA